MSHGIVQYLISAKGSFSFPYQNLKYLINCLFMSLLCMSECFFFARQNALKVLNLDKKHK